MIVLNTEQLIEDEHVNYGNLEGALYDKLTFEKLVRMNIIWVLECIFGPPESIWKENTNYRDIFVLDQQSLRRSVSFEVSRQVGKGKRRSKNGDMYSAAKGYFISLRFIHFGIEIVRYGCI